MRNTLVILRRNPLLFFVLILLSSCGGNIVIDNADQKEAVAEIGGEKVTVDAGDYSFSSLDPGEQVIKVTNAKNGTRDTTVEIKTGGVINAGGSEYVIWKLLYGIQKDKGNLINEKKVEVDSAVYTGDITLIPAGTIYIEKTWDIGLDEALPANEKLLVVEDFKVISKIFRKEEFIATYRRMASSPN